jgi:hypothetical protein
MLMVKKNYKIILYVLGSLGLLYVLIWIFTFKPELPLEYKHALDSLNRANAELIAKQKQIDSTISAYKNQIDSLDLAIGNIDIKKTEIHNHYQILGDKASKYNTVQIDSFFKARYNY